jgi:hypothetical protein
MRATFIGLTFPLVLLAIPAAGTPLGGGVMTATSLNCKTVNAKYHHGVGRPGAHDRTKSTKGPVTNFLRSKTLYLKYKSLDRDHDGIACETH